MDHNELRKKANAALKKDLLIGLKPEKGRRVTNGLSSGSLMLNLRLSGSPFIGYAWGRIIEIYGPESSGKTTLALYAIKEAQQIERATKVDVPCTFLDVEHSLDVNYASRIGIDLDNLTISQPDCGEDALNAVEAAVSAGYRVVVVDSVAALTPRAEIEGEAGESHMGLQARLMSQACRKLAGLCSKKQAIIIFINQVRMKLGLVFGNPETTTGGRALKFYATYRIEVRAPRKGARTGSLATMGQEEKVELGTNVVAKVVKNKVYPPHRRAEFVIEYGKGIDLKSDLMSFLEYAGCFKPNDKTKSKSNVLYIPSKKKYYTAKGLRAVLDEDDVQRDLIKIIQSIELSEGVQGA